MRIFILEDEPLIAETLFQTLNSLGYEAMEPCMSLNEAMSVVRTEQFDLALLDINISGKTEGLDVAAYIKEHFQIPIIFLTAYSDKGIVDQAKTLRPAAYLLKPYTPQEIFIAIEIAVSNHSSSESSYYLPHQKNTLNIKLGDKTFKISKDSIMALESEGKHTIVHTKDKKKYPLRMPLHKLYDGDCCRHMVQVHKSWVVNPVSIRSASRVQLELITGLEVPLGRAYRESWESIV